MITIYVREDGYIRPHVLEKGKLPPAGTVWIDLLNPEDNERIFISTALGIDLPNIQEMQEIEASSRLYAENGTLYLSTDILVGFDTPEPDLSVVLIAITTSAVVTVRYSEPRAIDIFANRIRLQPDLAATVDDAFLALLDAVTDRTADILEILGRHVDGLSRQIFGDRAELSAIVKPTGRRRGDRDNPMRKEKKLQEILCSLGRAGDTTHKIRDSVNGMARLVTFLGPRVLPRLNADQTARLHALEADVRSLAEHVQFMIQELSFLLDATLGQINIEQNNIIKFLSLVMVAFTPPTFFASMWGMNFRDMPEYALPFGYAMALSVMLISAIMPLIYFRKRGWM